jgi:hypothetical protein
VDSARDISVHTAIRLRPDIVNTLHNFCLQIIKDAEHLQAHAYVPGRESLHTRWNVYSAKALSFPNMSICMIKRKHAASSRSRWSFERRSANADPHTFVDTISIASLHALHTLLLSLSRRRQWELVSKYILLAIQWDRCDSWHPNGRCLISNDPTNDPYSFRDLPCSVDKFSRFPR